MRKIPTPALMFVAAFASATASGLLERWVSWFSGWDMEPQAVFAGMMMSALIASVVAGISRSGL